VNPTPLSARLFITSTIAVAVALLLCCLPYATFTQPVLLVTLLGLSCASATMTVALPQPMSASTLPVSYALDFASLLLLGPHETMIVAAAGAFSQSYLQTGERPSPRQTLFNAATLIVTVEAAGLVFHLLHTYPTDRITAVARPLVCAALTYFLVNTWLTAAAIGLTSGQRIATTWRTTFLWSAPNYVAGAGAAALAAWAVHHAGFWVAPLTFAPIYLTYRTYKVYMGRLEAQRHAQDTSALHLATIEALAGAIDAKDQMTNSHILRVRIYATGLAEAIGLPPSEIQAVKTAALLHDIGKLAVPEHILSKPGPLTPEEFQKVRIHPHVGAEIIAGVPFPYPVAPLILGHHERWDGSGYPQGLAGEAIPIGARILAIVDYYDAITSERPYHNALSHESALNLLKHEAGRALDPTLVDAFITQLPDLIAKCDATRPLAITALPPASSTTIMKGASEDSRAMAFENIGLAHREIYALYEIAQAMGTSLGVSDTMDLISSKLAKIIPWSGCALFLQQPDAGLMRCRYAGGIDTPRLFDTTLRTGEGLSGWVGRNRRTLVNANPHVEFEAAGVTMDLCLRSAIVCPLYIGETFIGSLALFHTEPNRYTDDHRRLVGRVAEQAGAVIHNAMTFDQAQEDSLTDPLTALPNRRSMFARLTHELSRAERLQTPLALIVLDIDEFKRINDTYGHHVGDQALREVADTLRNALRPYDLCVRYAGDEFIVVISDCSRETAELKRGELQERISTIEVEVRPGVRMRLGTSAGAAVFPEDGTTYEALLAEADRRMYQDKSARRSLNVPLEPDDSGWTSRIDVDEPVGIPLGAPERKM
jgi:diguanylate cyclase (GGDEF)-like protein/putative nucleotidyltransferase with HDIG domain